MNLNSCKWKEEKLNKLYKISNGNKLDQNKMSFDEPKVNFVSRQSFNNGVNCKVDYIDGLKPYDAGILTVALGGSYLGSCFVQLEPFYTAQNIGILEPRFSEMNLNVNLFLSSLIRYECKYKYFAFGRELNSHLDTDFTINIPIDENGNYNWKFMDEYISKLHNKPITTKNTENKFKLDTKNWEEFNLSKYFDIVPGIYHYPEEYSVGNTPYASASNENNGIKEYIDLDYEFEGNCIITGKIGCTAFYESDNFCATSDVNVFKPLYKFNKYIGIFITAIINFSENYKWNYGRQCRIGDSKKIIVKLPANEVGEPDWDFMENYIKRLKYGDRI